MGVKSGRRMKMISHLRIVPGLRIQRSQQRLSFHSAYYPKQIYTAEEQNVTMTNLYSSISQPPGRGPVPGPGINYTGPRDVLLEIVILLF